MNASLSIVTDRQNQVFFITLNRPEVLNSFNREMSLSLISALETAQSDASIRAVLLTGNGRAFCTGQDLAEVEPKPGKKPALGIIVKECYNPIVKLIREIEKPIVCAVNGVAAGAGANVALACDIVVAAEEGSFIQSFSKVGLIPDSGGTFMLPRLVGIGRATWMTFLGDKISAREAQAHGLVYKVFPALSLLDEARKIAEHLSQMPTRGFGLTKRAFNKSFENDLSAQLLQEEQMQQEAGLTDDYAEGVAAFLGKRKPVFKGC